MRNKLNGAHTALITPFVNGQVDETALTNIVNEQIDAGVAGIVPAGTTGESPTLTTAEHKRVIELCVQVAAGRCSVMAGSGANATAEAIELTQYAESVGADTSLQVCPYYNKPSQAGLYAHFSAIAQATKLPIILYSIPGRCNVEIAVETCVRLAADCKNIIAIKEAGGSLDRVSSLRSALPDDFVILSGDDGLTVPFMSLGAAGVISVAANLMPGIMVELTSAAASGDFAQAAAIHKKYVPLFSAFLAMDSNPVPIKAAMTMAGKCTAEIRLPLVPMSEDKQAKLKMILTDLGLL